MQDFMRYRRRRGRMMYKTDVASMVWEGTQLQTYNELWVSNLQNTIYRVRRFVVIVIFNIQEDF